MQTTLRAHTRHPMQTTVRAHTTHPTHACFGLNASPGRRKTIGKWAVYGVELGCCFRRCGQTKEMWQRVCRAQQKGRLTGGGQWEVITRCPWCYAIFGGFSSLWGPAVPGYV